MFNIFRHIRVCTLVDLHSSTFFFELFAFDVYLDDPCKDNITCTDLRQMLVDIYGEHSDSFYAIRALNILEEDHSNIDDYFDIDDFYDFTYHNNVIQFPIFVLQSKLQAKVSNYSFWEVIGEKRYRTIYGYSSIAEILRWGDFGEPSIVSSSTRKFSTCSAQSRFIVEMLGGKDDEDNSGEQSCSQGKESPCPSCPTNKVSNGNKMPRIERTDFNPTFSAYSSKYRRRSRDNVNINESYTNMNRRRSFDVKVILKDSVVHDAGITHRRHSVVN